jgi:hypothetical protein
MLSDVVDVIKLAFTVTLRFIYILLNRYIQFYENGYFYNSYYNNELFEANIFGDLKAIFVLIIFILFFARLYFLMDQHFVYMLGFGPGGMNPNGSNSNFNPNFNFRPNWGTNLNMADSGRHPNDERQPPLSIFPRLGQQMMHPRLHPISPEYKASIFAQHSGAVKGQMFYSKDINNNGDYLFFVNDSDGSKIASIKKYSLFFCYLE